MELLKKLKPIIKRLTLNKNFSVHTFGFGKDHDSKLMTGIA